MPPPRPPATRPAPPPAKAPPDSAPTNGNGKPATIGRLPPGKAPPPRIILNAVEGWGKTTNGAYADNPVILMAAGETGYETLRAAALVPDVDVASIESWPELLATVESLAGSGHKTVVLDALSGFERLCQQFVCSRDFDDNWGERGFAGYQRGYDVSMTEWLKLLVALDKLRADSRSMVLILSHCKISTFKNPLGPDYDRWVADCHHKVWAVTAKWVDAVLFGNFYVAVEGVKAGKGEAARKGKAPGIGQRIVYAERRDAFDAKNRYGMEPEFLLPEGAENAWATIWGQLTKRLESAR